MQIILLKQNIHTNVTKITSAQNKRWKKVHSLYFREPQLIIVLLLIRSYYIS